MGCTIHFDYSFRDWESGVRAVTATRQFAKQLGVRKVGKLALDDEQDCVRKHVHAFHHPFGFFPCLRAFYFQVDPDPGCETLVIGVAERQRTISTADGAVHRARISRFGWSDCCKTCYSSRPAYIHCAVCEILRFLISSRVRSYYVRDEADDYFHTHNLRDLLNTLETEHTRL